MSLPGAGVLRPAAHTHPGSDLDFLLVVSLSVRSVAGSARVRPKPWCGAFFVAFLTAILEGYST